MHVEEETPISCRNVGHVAHTRWTDALRWRREWDAHAIHEECRLVLVGDTVVHDRAVAVLVDVGLKTLHFSTPSNIAGFLAGHLPLCESLEVALGLLSLLMGRKAKEGITEACEVLEVRGKVHKCVLSSKALSIQHVQQSGAVVAVGQISEHEGSAFITLMTLIVTAGHATHFTSVCCC